MLKFFSCQELHFTWWRGVLRSKLPLLDKAIIRMKSFPKLFLRKKKKKTFKNFWKISKKFWELANNQSLRCFQCVVLCGAVRCCAVLCCTVRYCTVLYCTVRCCAVLCGAVLCCAVLCGAVRCCAMRCLGFIEEGVNLGTWGNYFATEWCRKYGSIYKKL